MDFLKQINSEGVTIILTTHYLEEAETLCRNIGIIDKGNLVENTSMKALLAQLDSETFILDIDKPAQLSSGEHFTVSAIDEHRLEIELNKKQSLNHVFAELTAQGVHVKSLRNKANRLEELFIELLKKGSAND